MAAGGADLAHLVSLRSDRHRAVAALFLSVRTTGLCASCWTSGLVDLFHASRKYSPSAQERRTSHRIQKQKTAMTSNLDRAEKLAWLRLARTPQVGPVTFRDLIHRFGTAQAAVEQLPRLAQRGGAKSFVLPPKEDAARELDLLEAIGGRMIAFCEPDFPPGLAALDPQPP